VVYSEYKLVDIGYLKAYGCREIFPAKKGKNKSRPGCVFGRGTRIVTLTNHVAKNSAAVTTCLGFLNPSSVLG
jgi:hypothetical protein